jgi:hypothetical protein
MIQKSNPRLCNTLMLLSINVALICALTLAADFVLGWLRPGAAQVGPVTPAEIPAGNPANQFAIYNSFSSRDVPLREWPIGSVVRKSTVPAAEFAGYTFPRDYYDLAIDPEGFVVPSRIHERPELTLAFLGGSTTEAHLMDRLDRFPYLAGRAIEKATGLKTNSHNGGVAGNTTLHALTLLIYKVAPLRPDYAILMEAVNDLSYLAHFGSYESVGPRAAIVTRQDIAAGRRENFTGGIRQLARATVPNLYAALSELRSRLGTGAAAQQDEFASARSKSSPALDDDEIVAKYAANVVSFVEVARARGIRPVLMTQVNRLIDPPDPAIRRGFEKFPPPMPYERYAAIYRRLNDTVRVVARERGVLLVDLDGRVPKDSNHFYDAVHLTAPGSHLVAELISAALLSDMSRR